MRQVASLTLIRHAESEGNARGDRVFDKANHLYKLSPKGVRQAIRLRNAFARYEKKFDVVFCSTFIRTQLTASLVFPGYLPIVDSRLDEYSMGVWYTHSREEMRVYYPLEFAKKEREGFYHYCAPGGENGSHVDVRIASLLETLRQEYAGKHVCIFTHGNWLLFFWRFVHGLPVTEINKRRGTKDYFDNCSVTELLPDRSGRLHVMSENYVY